MISLYDINEVILVFGPYFIMTMLVLLSIFNSSLKGFVYLFGVIILYGAIKFIPLLQHVNVNIYNENNVSIERTLMLDPFNTSLYVFSMVYLLLPMLEHGTFNIPLIIFLVSLYTHYMISFVSNKVDDISPMPKLFLSSLIGLIWGGFYYVFISSSDDTKKLLYYNEFNSSNRVACMRPSNTKFKCNVYKNGELIQ